MSEKTGRRRFIQVVGGSLLAVDHLKAQPQRRPNVLFIFSDQHRACSLPGEPYCQVEAPNLKRLASQGTTFRNCICNYPVCSPFRGMLLTGRWPYQTGIVDNSYALPPSELSLGEVFKRNGYRTGYIGKWHLQARDTRTNFMPPGPGRHGFEDWQVWYNTNPHYDRSFTYDQHTGQKIQPRGLNATLMTNAALRFVEENRAEPWMLMLSLNPPHPPWPDAPPDLMKRYDPAELQLRPNAVETPRLVVGDRRGSVRKMLQGYYAHITAMDHEIGRIMQRLEETGQVENTIVMYSTDHGEMLGSQGRMGKRLPYDESCRIPFIVRYPGAVPADRSTERLFSTIDFYPSICGLAGLAVPAHCEGKDFSSAMRAEQMDSPESAFIMHIEKDHASGGRNHPAPIFRGLVTARHTYAVGEIGRWCLYDNLEDPYQQRNLSRDPRLRSLMSELDGEIRDWLEKAEDAFPFHTGE